MSAKEFSGGKLVVGLMLVFSLWAFGTEAVAQVQYDGDESCSRCHKQKYDDYLLSGHPWKIFRTGGTTPGGNTYPHTPLPPLPADLAGWQDVEYIIGNFFWKARFIKRDGFIHTGSAVQWNLASQQFVAYNAGKTTPFDCGKCHTTGYDPSGNQNGIAGLIGTWAQEGVRCEACHGAGGPHAGGVGAKDCKDCHYRDEQFRMPWKNGFMQHHQQGEDLAHSPHKIYHCTECHDPHKSVVYRLGGVIKQCAECHQKRVRGTMGEVGLECIDCHMPLMTKSAVAVNQYKADVRGHLFRIMTEPVAAANNVTGGFWNQDANGDASITLDYACLGCHENMTLEQAAKAAKAVHRQPGLVDLTVNGGDAIQVVKKTDRVSVDFSVLAEELNASDVVKAQWWVISQTPRGWESWDGKKWKAGFRPWRKSAPVVDIELQNVLNKKLTPGFYTYWVRILPNGGSERHVDSVPVFVTRR